MIIIITGPSHTGKTVLAQRILEKKKYPYLSIDHLKMGLIRSKNTSLTLMDDDKLTDYLWPIVREMIKTAIENDQNLVIEGCYIPYDWRKDFDDDYLSKIQFIGLALSEGYIDRCFREVKEHASDVEKRLDDSDLTADWLKKINREFIDGFNGAGEKITVIDGDYEKTVDSVIE